MKKHLEKEEHPRWKRDADAQEEKFWEARQQEKEVVEQLGAPKVADEIDAPKVATEKTIEKRTAENTRGAASSNDPRPAAEKKQNIEDRHGEKRPGDENEQREEQLGLRSPRGRSAKRLKYNSKKG